MKVLERAQRAVALRLATPVSARQLLLVSLLVGLLAVTVFTRFWRLGTPGEFFFDEVYFPDTAQKILGRELGPDEAGPWEFFGSENTHPPLSKLFMAGGMAIFGVVTFGSVTGEMDNPFAWRFFGALAGVGSVVFIYLLGKRLFKSEFVGMAAAFLLTFEGLAFAQSRIATPDTYVLFFALGAVYFLVSDRFLLSGIFLGAAAACKWTAALTLFPIGLYFIYRFLRTDRAQRGRFLLEASLSIPLFFFLVPAYVYLMSYLPMLLNGHNLGDVWDLNRQAYEFHSSLEATHSYQSSWNTWPILARPVFFYVDGSAKIYNLGNPIIFWFGLPALGFALWEGVRRVRARLDAATASLSISGSLTHEQFALLFVVLTYLALWLPWAIQPRIMFLYHYLPALPFLILALAYAVFRLWNASSEGIGLLAGSLAAGAGIALAASAGIVALLVRLSVIDQLHAHWARPFLAIGSVAFLTLAVGYVLERVSGHPLGRTVAVAFLAVVALTFVYFYPHLAAVSVPGWLGDSYFWFSSWR